MSSLLNSITLRFSNSPSSTISEALRTLWPVNFESGTNPSPPSGSSTVTPLSRTLTILQSTCLSNPYFSSNIGHGSSLTCLCPKDMRLFSLLMSSTFISISSPFLTTSLGCRTFFVHERSEICTKPSTPSSSSTKAPNCVRFLTLPV